ncbi:MAG: hypothetical protein J0M02_08875, partial [Planctomycetes bacterium]|nr:hypothetical protein [Planctomycetota bacterium]
MRPALIAASSAIAASIIAVLAVSACSQPAEDPWHAATSTLLRRSERLSASGDVEAAAAVTAEIESRGDPAALARARTALSRARLAAGDTDGALELARRVPWADKSPAVAGERIALELAIRWRELLDPDGSLGSGMVPAVESADSDHGQPGGGWGRRRDAYAAIRALIDGGVRMVGREGGVVAMPAPAGLLALARFAYGGEDWSSIASALGVASAWDAATAHAVLGVALAEHDLDLARLAAERLWDGHAEDPLAADAYRRLRAWQLRRRSLHGVLAFWPYPELERRIDGEAARFAAAEAAARSDVAQEEDVGQAGLEAGVRRDLDAGNAVIEIAGDDSSVQRGEAAWTLALRHDGLRLDVPSLVAAGEPLPLSVSGIYGGAHAIALWRIADSAAWERLQRRPDRADLPAQPAWSRVLSDPRTAITAEGLEEGRYVATLTARAAPVVVLRSLRVAGSAVHMQMSSDGLLGWVVGRRSGLGESGAHVRL